MRHLKAVMSREASLFELPRERVHVLFQKPAGSIRVEGLSLDKVKLAEWDYALQETITRRKRRK